MQGFILGHLSTLVLLVAVLKLSLNPGPAQYVAERTPVLQSTHPATPIDWEPTHIEPESTEWLNALLHQVAGVYRSKLRDDLHGAEGDEVLRQRVENFIDLMGPFGVVDRIQVHSVNLGIAGPNISNARSRFVAGELEQSEFEIVYKDDVSISASTEYLFDFPIIGSGRLPVSLTIGLSVFSCRVVITPPPLSSPAPTFTLSVLPDFTLDLKSSLEPTTFLGTPKLTNVHILHKQIDNQLRRALSQWGTLKIVLPGFSDGEDMKE
ncbi:maintenance of mitochondrial morphology protein 1 [Russula ochroleuca]|jgi:maintenance of morphology protein 1|uniref:Maintenance of mitochondrial morphology protein 1 n=1 Tax=Russula ochroleuca TaxID=152965 RepID=A0A9P5MZ10_9AGAM|nr:maintenance of mitochondrial morphology protein 1 [Russula ochroleuca]